MMRNLLCLLTWIVITAAAYGQVRSANVLYTHFDSTPTRGFRVGDEVFVPLDALPEWGWSVSLRGDIAVIKMEGVEVVIPTRTVNNNVCVPVAAAVRKAGGNSSWVGDSLRVTSDLMSVRVQNGYIKVYSAFGISTSAVALDNGKGVSIDLVGASLGDKTEQILDENARLTQVRDGLVRLVVATENLPDLKKLSQSGRSFEYQLPLSGRGAATTAKPPKVEPTVEPRRAPAQPPKTITPPMQDTTPLTDPKVTPPLIDYLQVVVDRNDARSLNLTIPLTTNPTGPAQARTPDGNTLQVVLPGIQTGLPDGFHLDSPLVQSVDSDNDGTSTVLTFHFTRQLSTEIFMDGQTVRLLINRPLSNASLIGKVIVVDPGHGGADTGARSGGAQEKDLNLAIGTQIANKLAAEGATVIMTRKTDVFISLGNRAKMANDNDADLFISSHINSTGSPNSQSGFIIFHHKGNEVSRFLAQCIDSEVAKVAGIPDKGTWSDGKIYQSGFSVLRNTKMPGVLLELGFINSPTDRTRMISKDFQDKVAAAVVKGIKVYLANGS